MLQGANTDHFNPLAPKVHNSGCQFPLQINPVSQFKVKLADFKIFHLQHLRQAGKTL